MQHPPLRPARFPKIPLKAGFTAIEMVMTIGFMGMAAGFVAPVVREYQMYTDIDTASQHLVQAIRNAQLLSQNGKFDTSWGVYVPDGILFAGESYAVRNDDHDAAFLIPRHVVIHGPLELSFQRISGTPNGPADFCIESTIADGHRRLSMDQYGLVTADPMTDGDCDGNTNAPPLTEIPDTGSPDGEGGEDDVADGQTDDIAPDEEPEGGDGDVPCYIRFALDPVNGKLITAGTNDITVNVIDASGTYGAGGPPLSVRGSVSLDNGATWSGINNGDVLKGDEEMLLQNVTQGTTVILKVEGRYSWLFNKNARSDSGDGNIIVLRHGDALPPFAALRNREALPPELQGLLDASGNVAIGQKSLLFLTELDQLDPNTSDFRDAIILMTFNEKSGTCTDGAKPALKITFNRLENMGTGDATETIFVGPRQLPFAASQNIPLVDADCKTILDGGLTRDVPGLSLERGDGWIRILSYGSHENSSGKEVIDAEIRLVNASVTSIQNDTGADATEFPWDGESDDTSAGDEFVPSTDQKSILWKTRVIADNDALYIRWLPDAILAATESHTAAPPKEAAIDPCAIPFTVNEDGTITPGADAELTIRILGVDAVVGEEGSPRLEVRGQLSTDGGAHFESLWENRVLSGNETASFAQVPDGSILALGFTGRYSWSVNRSVIAGRNSDALRVVKSGDTLEELRIANVRGTLHPSLRTFVDEQGTLHLGPRDVAFLVDMGETLPRTYQDIIAILTVEKSSHGNNCLENVAESDESSASSSSEPPVVIVDTDGDGIADDVDLCSGTVIPEPAPSKRLLSDRFALTTTSDDNADPALFYGEPDDVQGEYSIADTRGCSCTQILDAIGSPSATRLPSEPVMYRQIKNLFSFSVDTSRKYGCTKSLLKTVAGH